MNILKYSGYFLVIPGFILLLYNAYLYFSSDASIPWITILGIILCIWGSILQRRLRNVAK